MTLSRRKPMKRGRVRPSSRTRQRRSLILEADLLVREYIFARDAYRCVAYGAAGVNCNGTRLQAAHILPKGKYPRMRHVPDNLLTLCFWHHMQWAHKDPVAFTRWLEQTYPGLYDRLLVSAAVAKKVDLKELIAVLGR